MSEQATTQVCPECGSRHFVNITLPVPAEGGGHHRPTRRARRCMDCTAQWPSGHEQRSDTADGAPMETEPVG